jgi:hypothetical protein
LLIRCWTAETAVAPHQALDRSRWPSTAIATSSRLTCVRAAGSFARDTGPLADSPRHGRRIIADLGWEDGVPLIELMLNAKTSTSARKPPRRSEADRPQGRDRPPSLTSGGGRIELLHPPARRTSTTWPIHDWFDGQPALVGGKGRAVSWVDGVSAPTSNRGRGPRRGAALRRRTAVVLLADRA